MPPSPLPPRLLLVYALIWSALAIAPSYRQDWLLENLIVAIALPLLWRGYTTLRFSDTSYRCLFLFFVLHAVGAHYTYSEVPYPHWFEALSGQSFEAVFGSGRNHYDRMVHFAYGLLVTPASIELLDARAPQRGQWRWWLPWFFICAHSTIYEVIEWIAAELFGGDLGQAFLGTQGDVWDAQKDAALAALGAALAVLWIRGRGRAPA